MSSLAKTPPTVLSINAPRNQLQCLKLLKTSNACHVIDFSKARVNCSLVCCTKLPPWEPSPVPYALTHDANGDLLKKTSGIFETLRSNDKAEAPVNDSEVLTNTINQPVTQFQLLKWPMWLLGPSLLLATGMVPTLWLPLSSIFLGPDIASLLSLIGLDCIFNLGATLFLLMANFCSQPKDLAQACNSRPPFKYQFWNMVASLSGFFIPLMMLYGSHKGVLQPYPPFISFAVLLGPYLLLLSVQILTDVLTWHWQSPVWLVTPIVYEAYRVLQLMRGLKLGAELSAPSWILHMIRGLISWWILIIGIQLMSVAWFAGFTAQAHKQLSADSAEN